VKNNTHIHTHRIEYPHPHIKLTFLVAFIQWRRARYDLPWPSPYLDAEEKPF
jgi:hypothetical protein